MDACGCDGFASIFDRRTADHDLRRYQRSGPDRTTRMLLDLLRPAVDPSTTILDIGSGIGIVDLELLRAGAANAVLVDGSAAYLEVARDQARRADLLDRVTIVAGDFVHRAGEIADADIVTLDRVICCYPDAVGLVTGSATRARRLYGLVLPHDRWVTRMALRLVNAWYGLRGRTYRAYAHPNARIDELASAAGLRLRAETGTFVWRVAVYERVVPSA